jgi:lysyl-tRNA synthetase class 2
MRTRAGEITVRATAVELLAKSLRPLPRGKREVLEDGSVREHGGVADPEFRYRQRYADLAVHPEIREVFRLRTRIVARIRHLLDEDGFLEVETPVLQPLYGGAAARPFVTHHNARYAVPADRRRAALPTIGRVRTDLRDRARLPERGHGSDAQS